MNLKEIVKEFPQSSGVYQMTNKAGDIIYIGKATSLRERVKSYFSNDLDLKTNRLMSEATDISYEETESPLEALILESKLIKKYSPKYNIKEKDDKSSLYVHISKEDFPRIEIIRGTDLHTIVEKSPITFGPYRSSKSLYEALELIRKIVPYRSCKTLPKKKCLYGFIGLCDAPCENQISKSEYAIRIKQVESFFKGKKKNVLSWLKSQLRIASKEMRYEDAAIYRDRIRALEHLGRVFLLKNDTSMTVFKRVEGYDVSNISGEYAVGSMVVFIEGMSEKSEYKKFKIKTVKGANDVAMIEEIFTRRFKHINSNESWDLPDLILVDGGRPQVNKVVAVMKRLDLKIPVVGLAKGPDRKKDEIVASITFPREEIGLLKEVRDEAHRFARNYYRKLHSKSLLK